MKTIINQNHDIEKKAGSNDPDYMGFLSKGDRGVINYNYSSLFLLISLCVNRATLCMMNYLLLNTRSRF